MTMQFKDPSRQYRHQYRQAFAAGTLVLLIAAPTFVQTTIAQTYDSCAALASNAPAMALEVAEEWRVAGGGLAARHCEALALARAGQFAEAARALEEIANASRSGELFEAGQGVPQRGAGLLAEFYSQAGNAWLLADQPAAAEAAFAQGIVEAGFLSDVAIELYVDRARARSATGLHTGAMEDLDVAFGIDPLRVDVLIFRASTFRQLGRTAEASDAVTRALEIDPDNREGLLERANLRAGEGNAVSAEEDLKRIILLYPDSRAAKTAQDSLEMLSAAQKEPQEEPEKEPEQD